VCTVTWATRASCYTNVHMPKINSGLFRVSWHKTELILNRLLDENRDKNHSITVWEL
jgi:hypothetical protein